MLNEKNITPSMSFQATMALLCCQNMEDLCDIASCFVSLVFSRAGVVIFNLKVHFIHFTKPDSACVWVCVFEWMCAYFGAHWVSDCDVNLL